MNFLPIPVQAGENLLAWLLVLFCKPIAAFLSTLTIMGIAYGVGADFPSAGRRSVSGEWVGFIERLRQSSNVTERNSLFLGLVSGDGSPILYPIENLNRHSWFVGSTGSGKTVQLISCCEQLVNRFDTTLIFVDLKAMSHEVFETLRAARSRVLSRISTQFPLKHFTLQHGESTYLFDIFSQSWWKKLPTHQRAGVLLSALSLAYSRAYGQSYYTDENYHLLHHVLKKYRKIGSFFDLSEKISNEVRFAKSWELSDSTKEAADHVNVIIQRLASIGPINSRPGHSAIAKGAAIDFAAGFQSPHLYYFALNAINNSLLAGEVGRLITSALVNAATTCERKTRVVLVIDEWQEMVTSQLQILLRQARALNIGIVLANQTTSDLIQPDVDLRPVVEGNTALQAWLKVTDEVGREQLRRLGGKRIERLYGQTVSQNDRGTSYSNSWQESVVDRLDPNLVSEVASSSDRFILRITDNVGYSCYGDLPFVARSLFTMSKTEYDRRVQAEWPAPSENTIVADEVSVIRSSPPLNPQQPTQRPTHRIGG